MTDDRVEKSTNSTIFGVIVKPAVPVLLKNPDSGLRNPDPRMTSTSGPATTTVVTSLPNYLLLDALLGPWV